VHGTPINNSTDDHAHQFTAFLIEVNVVVEYFYEELDLYRTVHALVGDFHPLLQTV
jgi:hypothetical protein